MTNDEFQMTNQTRNPNSKWGTLALDVNIRSFELRPSFNELAQVLREHKQRANEKRDAWEWVFPSANGKPHASGALTKPMRRVASIIGLRRRITPHGLRRTLNTLALQVAPAETI